MIVRENFKNMFSSKDLFKPTNTSNYGFVKATYRMLEFFNCEDKGFTIQKTR